MLLDHTNSHYVTKNVIYGDLLNISKAKGEHFAEKIMTGQIDDEATFLAHAREIYPEINYYKGLVAGSPDGSLLAGDAEEQKRTELSLLCLYWLVMRDYAKFTACQSDLKTKLTQESFDALCSQVTQLLPTSEAIHAMFVTMAIHDLGKIKWFEDKVLESSQKIAKDHDEILLQALTYCPELMPSYLALAKKYQDVIKGGWEMSVSVGQFTQAENLPANLTMIVPSRSIDPHCADFFFFHELLDVAGVLGHIKSNGSAILNEPTLFTYNAAWAAVTDPMLTCEKNIYDAYLKTRGIRLGLDVKDKLQRACIRVCCMCRFHSKEDAIATLEVLSNLPSEFQSQVIDELNVSGLENKKGILIYYAPQLFINLLKNNSKNVAIEMGCKILGKIYSRARELPENMDDNGVISINIHAICNLAVSESATILSGIIAIDPKTWVAKFYSA